ncbi:DUF7426 family protein [Streptomyces sp. NPDC004031]
MAKFEALDGLYDDCLELPIPGRDGTKRTYRIPSPPADDGLMILRVTTLATKLMAGGEPAESEMLDDDEERDLVALALGPAAEEMSADGVDWAWTRHAGLTAILWVSRGVEDAEAYWQAAGDPTKLAAPQNRADRRAAAKTSGSAKAAKTPRRASTNGTSGRPVGKTAARSSKG